MASNKTSSRIGNAMSTGKNHPVPFPRNSVDLQLEYKTANSLGRKELPLSVLTESLFFTSPVTAGTQG